MKSLLKQITLFWRKRSSNQKGMLFFSFCFVPCLLTFLLYQGTSLPNAANRPHKAVLEAEVAKASLFDTSHLIEVHLEEKVSALLKRLVGKKGFHRAVYVQLDKETEAVQALSLVVVIDKNVLDRAQENFQKELENQLTAVGTGYGVKANLVIDYIPFEKHRTKEEAQKHGFSPAFILTLLFVIAVLVSLLFPFLKRSTKTRVKKKSSASGKHGINFSKLALSVQQEDPKNIALMLSYLEPARAEQMIAALDKRLQEEVLFYLSEMERDQR